MAQQLDAFQTAFEHTVRELVRADDLAQTYLTDGSLSARPDITSAQAQHLAMQVWGEGFAPPSFTDEFAVIRQQAMGVNHKKVWLQKRRGANSKPMFWRCTDEIPSAFAPFTAPWPTNGATIS